MCFCSGCKQAIFEYRKKSLNLSSDLEKQILVKGYFSENSLKNMSGMLKKSSQSLTKYFSLDKQNTVSVNTEKGVKNLKINSENYFPKKSIDSLQNIDELEILKVIHLLCEKCILHCQSEIHLFGGSFKRHLITFSELKKMALQEDKLDLLDILKRIKSSFYNFNL